jgi:CO/xanthine dehydrogenase FAD-binding subunit
VSVADLGSFAMERATSLDALCARLGERAARGERTVLLAGGTDWMVEQEMARPFRPGDTRPLVVDVSRLDELRGVTLAGDRLRIGAAATYLELRRHDGVTRRAPLLERMARDVGAVQIQARGTLGGNLATASPAADGVAALAAYDATIVVRSARGERRIAMRDLQTGYKRSSRAPDEVIVAIEIDLPREDAPWVWRKVGTRKAQSISKVALAGVAEVDAGRATRLGLGMASVAPVTALLPSVRALALSKPLADIVADEVERAVTTDVSPIDDVRSTRDYRVHCAVAVTKGFLRELGAGC